MSVTPLAPNGEEIATAVCTAAPHSDQLHDGLVHCAQIFIKAHQRVPFGTSIEVGTRNGGSAFLFLQLIEILYKNWHPPMLLTCDPYGGKPYVASDTEKHFQPYWNENYQASKKLLAPFSNHAHFLMSSHEFLSKIWDTTFWYCGQPHKFAGLSFVFLDGEHEANSVVTDLDLIWDHWMDPKNPGLVLVDNADKDPKLLPLLTERFLIESKSGMGAWNNTTRVVVSGRKEPCHG